jgi:NAD(P)-dependent dehydrogenase (short-subunit alcohol dehydrogenase family)
MIPSDLAGKVALVTGAARGLGQASALRLAELGADVAIVDVDAAALSRARPISPPIAPPSRA